jgi:hypothetical protein
MPKSQDRAIRAVIASRHARDVMVSGVTRGFMGCGLSSRVTESKDHSSDWNPWRLGLRRGVLRLRGRTPEKSGEQRKLRPLRSGVIAVFHFGTEDLAKRQGWAVRQKTPTLGFGVLALLNWPLSMHRLGLSARYRPESTALHCEGLTSNTRAVKCSNRTLARRCGSPEAQSRALSAGRGGGGWLRQACRDVTSKLRSCPPPAPS